MRKSYGISINQRANHMHASAKPMLKHASTGWNTSLFLAPAATLAEGPEQN